MTSSLPGTLDNNSVVSSEVENARTLSMRCCVPASDLEQAGSAQWCTYG